MACPMPIMQTKKAMAKLEGGQVLEVIATDRGSQADMISWARRTGHQYIGTIQQDGVWQHYLRKADPAEVRPERDHPVTIDNREFEVLLSQRPHVLDVREPMEFAFGHVPGAVSMPLGRLQQDWLSLATWRPDPVYVICRTAHRSDIACQLLTEHGFIHAINVVTGMAEWTGPIETQTP